MAQHFGHNAMPQQCHAATAPPGPRAPAMTEAPAASLGRADGQLPLHVPVSVTLGSENRHAPQVGYRFT